MITETFISVNGKSIFIKESGQGENTIVFIHGNSSSSNAWLPQLEDKVLQANYKLIAVDLLGCGQSAKSDDYTLKTMRQFMVDLIHELDVNSYILVGLSLGTCYIAEAIPHLKNCKGYVLVSPNVTNNEQHPGTFMNIFPEVMAMYAQSSTDEELNALLNKFIYIPNPILSEIIKSDYRIADPLFRMGIPADIAAANWSDEIQNIENTGLPACIIFGSEDVVLKKDYLDTLSNRWKNKTHCIDHAAHYVNFEQAEIFNSLLNEYAEEVFG